MILNRYFLKTIFSYTASVSVIFLLIIVSSRSIQYLDQATRGEINPEVVFWVILFRLPEFTQIILPLSFFLGIVLTLGKLRSESEFVVMQQNGFSLKRLHTLLFACSTLVCVVIYSLSAWLTPKFDLQIKDLLQQKTLKEKIMALTPGEFHKINDSTLVYSKESSNEDLTKVFIKNTSKEKQTREFFVFADKAYVQGATEKTLNLNTGSIFLSKQI
jgi:Predicted permeases